MKIYLFLKDRILNFSLPTDVVGSFSFDEDSNEESKLINVEAKDGSWVIYSTTNVSVVDNNNLVGYMVLKEDTFYKLRRGKEEYLIYVGGTSLNGTMLYNYGSDINLVIGNDGDCTVKYSCPIYDKLKVVIRFVDNKLTLESNESLVYVNNRIISGNSVVLNLGDQVSIFGLKILFLNGILVMSNPGGKVSVISNSNLKEYNIPNDTTVPDKKVKSVDLYDKSSYFSKSPRIRRAIKKYVLTLSPPPDNNSSGDLPMILTVGPMLTMGVTSGIMVMDTINQINTGKTTMKDSWPALATAIIMLVSMLLWPIITAFYSKRMLEKKEKNIKDRYNKYLGEVKEELSNEVKHQKEVLIENLISIDECLNTLNSKNMNFWNRKLDQNDLLMARIGWGSSKFDVDIKYPEKGFSIDESVLKKDADKIVEDYKYIEDVPMGYSFSNNKMVAVMGVDKYKNVTFVNNILLQFLTFYSYEDLKIVVFTNENNYGNWEYLKYTNHNFSNDKSIRFFSSTVDSGNKIADYLKSEIAHRIENKEKDKDKNNVKVYRPYYLVIVDDYERVKEYDFIDMFADEDTNIGVSMIIIEEKLSKLPSKCNDYITLQTNGKSGILKNTFDDQEQITFTDEVKYGINYMELARIISNIPIEFEEKSGSLPDAISFMEMEKVGKVEQLNVLNRWNSNDSTQSLKAEIGVNEKSELMYLDLHEKYHGPHGLIAGTTGSGKSEFIITYILSMCINYSPDDVAFILIDYKGGGLALAFENKLTGVTLPHLAGTITNLDKAEMDRTLVSIDSEVKRRQKMFNEARDKLGESTIDIYKYQRHFHEGRLEEPIPHLFIICDEFAELKAQQPDFMDNLISVARIGRSLGVHLILATQKPSGVVNDQIWSNTKFRVCLKVQDEADSKEMLKRPEAAHITQAGRFYLQVGYDEIFALGQSGWGGAKYYPSNEIVKQVDNDLNYIDDCGVIVRSVREESDIKIEAQGEQLAAIMKNIISISSDVNKKARRLWLDNIPPIILVDSLCKKYNFKAIPYVFDSIIGEYDAPEAQEQGVVKYNYLEDGNTIVYSMNSSESEMFLSALIYSTSRYHTAEEINYYIIDFGSESLRRYMSLPHVGGIVFNGEDDKYNNLMKLVREEIVKRKKLFVDFGGDYNNYIKNSGKKIPLCTIIINSFDSFYEQHQDVYDEFPELVRDSARYGIVFIFTCSATNSIPNKIAQNFTNSYAFKIKDQSDYMYIFNTKSRTVPRDTEGRGLLFNDGLHEFQIASITNTDDELNTYMIKYIDYQKQVNKVKAKKIPVLPNCVRINDVSSEISTLKNVPVGIMKNTLDVCCYNFIDDRGTIISSKKIENITIFAKSLLEIFRNIPNTNLMIMDAEKKLGLNPVYFPNYYTDSWSEVLYKLGNYIDGLKDNKSNIEGILFIYGLDNFYNTVIEAEAYKDNNSEIVDDVKEVIDDVEEMEPVEEVQSSTNTSSSSLDMSTIEALAAQYDPSIEEAMMEEEDEKFSDYEEENYENEEEDSSEEVPSYSGKELLMNFLNKVKRYGKISVVIVEETKRLKKYEYEDWYSNFFSAGNGIWVGNGAGDQSILKIDNYNKEMQGNYKNNMGFLISEGEATLIKLLDFITEEDNNGK
ncbi:MAG: type VII secretion protein EssC [Bacilli bacterium]|nr:type VII secretion protein EssC [Bacilli bacterium]